jgi:four helix bundle protein
MNETTEQLQQRTKALAVRIVRLYRSLLESRDTQIMGTQLLRCRTPVGANYRSVCRARSEADFVSKTGIVLEEADETVFWL